MFSWEVILAIVLWDFESVGKLHSWMVTLANYCGLGVESICKRSWVVILANYCGLGVESICKRSWVVILANYCGLGVESVCYFSSNWEFDSIRIIHEWYLSVNFFHLCQWCNKLYVKATSPFILCTCTAKSKLLLS